MNMRKLARPRPSRLVLAALLAAALFSPARAEHAEVWSDWITSLKSQGYVVTQGASVQHSCDALVAVFKTCFGNNPAGLYADIELPIDNEYVDPCYNAAHDCSGSTPNLFTSTAVLPDGSQASVNPFYRLGESDALVLVIKLPPKAAYFGTQSYVYSRARSLYSQKCRPAPSYQAPNPCRMQTRASVGAAVNDVVIANQFHPRHGRGGTIAVVTTPNQALFAALGEAFAGVGGDRDRLFAEPLGATIGAGAQAAGVVTGLGAGSDELNTLVRYTLPQDAAAATRWQNAVGDNIQVFRVRRPGLPAAPYNVTLAAKSYATDESVYKDALNELANSLQGWLATVNGANVSRGLVTVSATYSATGEPQAGYIGTVCLNAETDCLRDTQDTDAYRFGYILKLQNTALFIGVESAYTGNATYTTVGMFRGDVFEGVASLAQTNPAVTGFDSGTLGGSAADLIASLVAAGSIPPPSPALAKALPNLYVAIVTRACATPDAPSAPFFCAKGYTVNIDSTLVPLAVPVLVGQRAYMLPGDTRGANPHFLATPILLN
ncbi:MAG: hypothetical protein P4L83_21395 [Nevskia sp.]|nr:hypothetical protein [Nevskia sp.]